MNQQEIDAQALIDDHTITAYKIEQETGVSASTISKLRNEKRDTSKLQGNTQAQLAQYWDSLQHPFLHFWETEDMKIFEHWFKQSTETNWHNEVRRIVYYDYENDPAWTEYRLNVSLSPLDDLTEDLFQKYLDKLSQLRKKYPSDLSFESLQPMYANMNRYSFLNHKQLNIIADKVHETLNAGSKDYSKEFLDGYKSTEIIRSRSISVTGLVDDNYPEYHLMRGIQLSIDPLLHPMSPAPY